MLIHMFAFQWSTGANDADKRRAVEEIRAFRGQIPGLLEVHVGVNTASLASEYETGGVMKFIDGAALSAYNCHPRHQASLAWLLPLVRPLEIDFETCN